MAYIIYYDQKGVLRKEKSWNSWRDKKIEPSEFKNTPTSGFVLNKKAGGYSTGWNHRQTYVRIYDPRDFEFEISIPNLLYILENTNSIKGKGLEGEFVYGWDGTELVLIPTDSPDYTEISKFNEILHNNNHIKTKDLIIGATYKHKDNSEWVYMGRFDYWKVEYDRVLVESNNHSGWSSYKSVPKNVNKGKYHYFAQEGTDWYDNPTVHCLHLKSLGDKFISMGSTNCVQNYADLFDKLECTTSYSPLDESKDEYIPYTYEEFCEKVTSRKLYTWSCYSSCKDQYDIGVSRKDSDLYFYRDKSYKTVEGTLEDIYTIVQPMYKNQYLMNGKLYRKGF